MKKYRCIGDTAPCILNLGKIPLLLRPEQVVQSVVSHFIDCTHPQPDLKHSLTRTCVIKLEVKFVSKTMTMQKFTVQVNRSFLMTGCKFFTEFVAKL